MILLQVGAGAVMQTAQVSYSSSSAADTDEVQPSIAAIFGLKQACACLQCS
jgi:hypothetical protein